MTPVRYLQLVVQCIEALSYFETIKLINQGGQAYIFHATIKDSSHPIIIKVPSQLCPNSVIQQEYDLLKRLEKESHICKLVYVRGHAILPFTVTDMDDMQDRCMLFLTYHGDSMRKYVKQQHYLNPNGKEFWNVLRSSLDALKRVHSQGYLHRDISPSNICIDHNYITLIDFGLAVPKNRKMGTKVGTKKYQRYRLKSFSEADDVLALCYVVWELYDRFTFPSRASDKQYYRYLCNLPVVVSLMDYLLEHREDKCIHYDTLFEIVDRFSHVRESKIN